MITKGRVFIKSISAKLVKEYADITLIRPTGLVNITSVYHTRIEYKFTHEDLIVTSYNLAGFGVLAAYMPHVEEEFMYTIIDPNDIVRYCSEIVGKHNTFKLNEYYSHETFEFEPFSLDSNGRIYARIKRFQTN